MRLAILAGVLILGAVVAAWFNPVFTLAIAALILAVFFLARNLEFGVLVLVFFFPYLGLVVDFGEWEIFREVPYLRDVNAPFVDFYGLVLLVAWLLNLVVRSLRIAPSEDKSSHYTWSLLRSFPHLRPYLLFWLSGLLSLLKVPAINFAASLKYFARPFTFAYAVFFAMPINILTRVQSHNPPQPSLTLREGGLLYCVLSIFYFTGLLSAINGLLGLFFGVHEGFPRATPLGFFGVNPLGPNHNLLAETLIATAPAGLLLMHNAPQPPLNLRGGVGGVTQWIRYGMWFQWIVALLTFSRTAWIAVAVQVVVYILLRFKIKDLRLKIYALARVLFPVLAVVIAFLLVTTFSETVRGSTLSRLDQVRIAWFYFLREPLLGQGIGTFIPTLWQTRAFLLDYGEPLEAHGILFKLMFEQGLLGLMTFGIFVGAILREIWKKGNVAALMIAAGSLTYQLFNTTYYTSKLWVPLALAVVISRIYAYSNHNPKMVS